MNYADKIRHLRIELPPAPKPAGSYHPLVISGDTAYLSGQISRKADGTLWTGKAGKDLSLEDAQKAARAAAANVLSVIQNVLGFESFDRVLRVVGYVQCAPDFYEISQVMNGASELFLDIFGDNGIHARSAVGMASLPLNAAVEIEVTIKLKPHG